MRYQNPCCILVVLLIVGASGCTALSGLGAQQETFTQQTLPPGLPAPALATLERLVGGGEIWMLRQKEIGGKTVYDVRAKVGDTDVRYEIACDGTVVATREGAGCTGPLEGTQAASRNSSVAASAMEGEEAPYKVEGSTPRPL